MKAEFSCALVKYESMDGTDYDCEYEFAGEVTCDDCMINGGKFDPRRPREDQTISCILYGYEGNHWTNEAIEAMCAIGIVANEFVPVTWPVMGMGREISEEHPELPYGVKIRTCPTLVFFDENHCVPVEGMDRIWQMRDVNQTAGRRWPELIVPLVGERVGQK